MHNKKEPLDAYALLLSEDCNLACKYCYERKGIGHAYQSMPFPVIDHTFELIKNNYTIHGTSVCDITLFGGEPFLNIPGIEYILETASELSINLPIEFSIHAISNGTILNKKIFEVISKHNNLFTQVQLSVDGIKHVHDKYRVLKSGKGSFALVERNIHLWKTLLNNKATIHSVVTKDSIPFIYENYSFFRYQWGILNIWFLPAKDDNYSELDIELYDQQMGLVAGKILHDLNTRKTLETFQGFSPFSKILSPGQDIPCGAGKNYCTIDVAGDIYPCHHFRFIDTNKSTVFGNVFEGIEDSRRNLFIGYGPEDIVGCQDCELRFRCFRCLAENYDKYGSPFIQVKGAHCKFMKIDNKYQKLLLERAVELGLVDIETANSNVDVVQTSFCKP